MFFGVYIFKSNGTVQLKSFFLFIRDFQLSCRGSGVHPPLELSHSLVRFRDTAVSDCSSTVVFLTNHEVMKEGMTPVPPRLFSFALPSDGEISISPAAGRLQPGQVDSLFLKKIVWVYMWHSSSADVYTFGLYSTGDVDGKDSIQPKYGIIFRVVYC